MKQKEIKFRAWDKKEKEMSYMKDYTSWGAFWDTVNPGYEDYILLQFTGLLDRNGKEIYEGDVVVIKCFGRSIIKFDKARFYGHQINTENRYTNFPLTEYQSIKVIGNIYENPELL